MATEDVESVLPIPFFPQKSTVRLMDHFDEEVYRRDPNSHLYRFLEALTGGAGAGDLRRQTLIQRLNNSVEGLQFRDIDSLFYNLFRLSRLPEETYTYDPMTSLLTSDQWDEVKVKDQLYKSRSIKFLEAATVAGTVESLRKVCQAILNVDADVFEVWKYAKNPTIVGDLGRSATLSGTGAFLNEVILKPHKLDITEAERLKLLRFIDLIRPQDCIVTIDPLGLSVHKELSPRGVGATDSYFEVQRWVTGLPDLSTIPEPEYLAQEVWDQRNWLLDSNSTEAPTTANNSTQESSLTYRLVKVRGTLGGSGIVKVSYQSLDEQGRQTDESTFSIEAPTQKWTEWLKVPLADSPDNFPGGKNGITPLEAPAKDKEGNDYVFEYSTQEEFFLAFSQEILRQNGEFDGQTRYRLPLSEEEWMKKTYEAEQSIKSKESLSPRVTTPWYSSRGKEK